MLAPKIDCQIMGARGGDYSYSKLNERSVLTVPPTFLIKLEQKTVYFHMSDFYGDCSTQL